MMQKKTLPSRRGRGFQINGFDPPPIKNTDKADTEPNRNYAVDKESILNPSGF